MAPTKQPLPCKNSAQISVENPMILVIARGSKPRRVSTLALAPAYVDWAGGGRRNDNRAFTWRVFWRGAFPRTTGYTVSMPDVLRQLNLSLAVTTYQAGKSQETVEPKLARKHLQTFFDEINAKIFLCTSSASQSQGGDAVVTTDTSVWDRPQPLLPCSILRIRWTATVARHAARPGHAKKHRPHYSQINGTDHTVTVEVRIFIVTEKRDS